MADSTSRFLEMPDFLRRFHNVGDSPETYGFTDAVSGTIVGLLSIGTMFGALCSAPIADRFGRKVCIICWNLMFCVGVVIQMASSDKWYQVALGRWVAGLGVGGLSVLTPMYQSETAPRHIRGAMVGCYQLFITLGIFVAYCINYGTEANDDASAWRIPMGVGFIPPVLMITGICFLPESPRWDYRHNNIERARTTIARSYGVGTRHWEVQREMREIQAKFDAEFAGGGKHKWYEIFTGPRMAYRTLLGVSLQALQQLTGANFVSFVLSFSSLFLEFTPLTDLTSTVLLLRHHNFRSHRPQQQLRNQHDSRRRKLRLHLPRTLRNRKSRSSRRSHVGRSLDVHVLHGLLLGGTLRPRPNHTHQHAQSRSRHDSIRLPLHRRLRHDLGTRHLGRRRRTLSNPLPYHVYGSRLLIELDLEFLNFFLFPLHHQRH